ncbi:MAG: class I SAM-dependent methyltransferase [Lachnospiraceae bacterium]|nr:class I SAM-dependent methyltransferase [Lachnospiraceae bacterium]
MKQGETIQKIGKVTLDYAAYPGEDFYCDGASEDALLNVVKELPRERFHEAVTKEKSWEFLYHLSPLRGNIVEWLDIRKEHSVLEVGSGCGAITTTLSEKAGKVTCVELSKKRSEINANRNKDRDNIYIKVGNFQDIEPDLPRFDYICLIGVLEYAGLYIQSDNPYVEFIKIIRKHLAPGGKIVIAIENRLGMKYFAGCREDHLGSYFAGIENYPTGGPAKTFSRNGLEKLCKEAEINNYSFYYPYPDYKFMHTLYSDDRLPMRGELSSNIRNFDRERLLLFDEKNAFDGVIEEGVFPLFSNSYVLLIGAAEETIYVKYSNDRKASASIKTELVKENRATGTPARYRKVAATEEGRAQLSKILTAHKILKKRFFGSELVVCPVTEEADGVYFPVIAGRTLEEELDEALSKGDKERFAQLLNKFVGIARYRAEEKATDFDLIFANILVDDKGVFHLIDYEWTEEISVNPDEILKRTAFVYLQDGKRNGQLSFEELLNMMDVAPVPMHEAMQDEIAFQKKVAGDHPSLADYRLLIGNEVITMQSLLGDSKKNMLQVYEDTGSGFAESQSFFVEPVRGREEEKDTCHVEVPIHEGVVNLRLDPAMESCGICLEQMKLTDSQGKALLIDEKALVMNGIPAGNKEYFFDHGDPNFTVAVPSSFTGGKLSMIYRLWPVHPEMAKRLALAAGGKKKKLFR